MDKVNIRIANFLKMISMLMVLGSLIYMYGYVVDRVDFLRSSNSWINEIPKNQLFYGGLVTFALSNLLLNVGLSIYKSSRGFNPDSYFFKNEKRKEKLIVLLTYSIAGVNLLIAATLFYIALMRINDVADPANYIYIPGFGILVLLGIIVAIIVVLLKK